VCGRLCYFPRIEKFQKSSLRCASPPRRSPILQPLTSAPPPPLSHPLSSPRLRRRRRRRRLPSPPPPTGTSQHRRRGHHRTCFVEAPPAASSHRGVLGARRNPAAGELDQGRGRARRVEEAREPERRRLLHGAARPPSVLPPPRRARRLGAGAPRRMRGARSREGPARGREHAPTRESASAPHPSHCPKFVSSLARAPRCHFLAQIHARRRSTAAVQLRARADAGPGRCKARPRADLGPPEVSPRARRLSATRRGRRTPRACAGAPRQRPAAPRLRGHRREEHFLSAGAHLPRPTCLRRFCAGEIAQARPHTRTQCSVGAHPRAATARGTPPPGANPHEFAHKIAHLRPHARTHAGARGKTMPPRPRQRQYC
jgi:hypothetical protein